MIIRFFHSYLFYTTLVIIQFNTSTIENVIFQQLQQLKLQNEQHEQERRRILFQISFPCYVAAFAPIHTRTHSTITTTSTTSSTASSSSSSYHNKNHIPSKLQSQSNLNKHLVLIGGGHAHLQVIKAFNQQSRPKHVHVTLIDIQSFASYSGMVPGCIANLYTKEETEIDLVSLAHWAGIKFIRGEVISIDPELQQISFQGTDATNINNDNDNKNISGQENSNIIPYDVLSVDIGSKSRGVTIPGVKEYSIPTRPISSLLVKIEKQDDIIKDMNMIRLVVIGGGLAGIELALTLRGRWKSILQQDYDDNGNNHKLLEVVILNSGKVLLQDESNWCRSALEEILKERNIHVQHNCHVEYIDKENIHFNNGEYTPYTHCIWATGAEAHSLAWEIGSKGIAISDRGWIRVHPSLQCISHSNIFAAGDCATIESPNFNPPPSAGVFAVRSGPILVENISNALNDCETSMVEYCPQDDFLKLIACGDGTALGFRFNIPLQGEWVWKLKDKIDNMFMDLFRVGKLPQRNEDDDGASVNKEEGYDTSQYDERVSRREPLQPKDGACLLLQKDDNVDFERAWDVLRDMMDDENYREEVLHHIKNANKQRM